MHLLALKSWSGSLQAGLTRCYLAGAGGEHLMLFCRSLDHRMLQPRLGVVVLPTRQHRPQLSRILVGDGREHLAERQPAGQRLDPDLFRARLLPRHRVGPIQVDSCRPWRNSWLSPMAATSASAVSAPTPGIWRVRTQRSSWRTCRSIRVSHSAGRACNCRQCVASPRRFAARLNSGARSLKTTFTSA